MWGKFGLSAQAIQVQVTSVQGKTRLQGKAEERFICMLRRYSVWYPSRFLLLLGVKRKRCPIVHQIEEIKKVEEEELPTELEK